IEPYSIPDHVRREPVTLKRYPLHQSPAPLRPDQPESGDRLALDCQHRLGIALLVISLNFGLWGFLSAPAVAAAITETIQEFTDG
ncbi:MAG: hypothetical protein ACHP84_10340, partial [Caulobacterales bacterium]